LGRTRPCRHRRTQSRAGRHRLPHRPHLQPRRAQHELLLAQSLGSAGHTEEAYAYFLGLWETRPGDGFINLQLARLAAQKRDQQTAINDYRAAIYGTWEGDGVDRRREVRFELARYLIAQGQPAAARAELLVAGGNAPDTLAIDLSLADLLQHAASPADALAFYQKALAHDPKNLEALTNAARISFSTGNYSAARRLLERALREDPKNEANTTLLANSVRILQLTPADTLPAKERVSRILTDRAIARKRWTECAATTPQPSPLTTRWASPDAAIPRNVLLHDPDKQAATLQLLYDTEIKASQICTAPTGDDALLLLLAQAAQAEEASHP